MSGAGFVTAATLVSPAPLPRTTREPGDLVFAVARPGYRRAGQNRCQLAAAPHAGLVRDGANVVVHRVVREPQGGGDLLRRLARHHQPGYRLLPRGQAV